MRTQFVSSKQVGCMILAVLFVAGIAMAKTPVVKARKRSETELQEVSRPSLEIHKKPFEKKELMSMPFYVFNNRILPPVQNFALSGFMGDGGDLKISGSYDEVFEEGYPTLKVEYGGKGPNGWAGAVWQNPANNWGTFDGGYNLSNAKNLIFWAKGEKGGEIVSFTIGGTAANYPDSATISTGPIVLNDEWTEYVIDLSENQLFYIAAGFGFVVKRDLNPYGCVFYLDDIKYDK